MADLKVIIKALFEGSDEIDKAKGQIEGLGGAAEEMEKVGSKSFGDFQDNVAIAMLGINQAIEVGTKLAEAAQVVYENTVGKALTVAGEIEELMRVSGDAPEILSTLRLEAEKADVPFDDLYKAMENLNKNGIPPTVENLVAIADEYVNLQDPIDKARLLTENFGTAGDEIAPMLEDIAGGIKEVQDSGLIFTQGDIDAVKDYKDAVSGLGGVWDEFLTNVGMKVIPTLTDALNNMTNVQAFDKLSAGFKDLGMNVDDLTEGFDFMGLGITAVTDGLVGSLETAALWASETQSAFMQAGYSAEDAQTKTTELFNAIGSGSISSINAVVDMSASYSDFMEIAHRAGVDVTGVTEELFESLIDVRDVRLGEKSLEIEDSQVQFAIDNIMLLDGFTLEEKRLLVNALLDTSEVDNWSPPTKTGTVVYQLNKGQTQAVGGSVNAGNPYTWQEYGYRGEVFVPSADGFVLSRADAERALARALYGGGSAIDPAAIGKAVAQAMSGVTAKGKGGNVYNLTMPTSNNPADVRTAFELMEAWGA